MYILINYHYYYSLYNKYNNNKYKNNSYIELN